MGRNAKKKTDKLLATIDAQQWLISDAGLASIREIAARENDLEAFESAGEKFDIEALITTHDGPLVDARYALRAGTRAIIPIIGPIFPRANLMTNYSGATSITAVARDTRVAIEAGLEPLLYISTPGGVVEGISEYAAMVAELNVGCVVSGQCTSAGYWIASQAREIIVADTAVVGNIGAKGPNPKPEDDDSIVSENAPNKKMSPKMVRGIVNEIEGVFLAAVAKGRGVSVEHVIEHYGQGGVFVGAKAVAAGLADRVGTLDGVLAEKSSNQRPASNAINISSNTGDDPMSDKNEGGTLTVAEHKTKVSEAVTAALATAKTESDSAQTTAVATATTEATKAERDRISAIFEAGKDKPVSARNVAFDTDMDVEAATAFLEKQPAEAKAPGGALNALMNGEANPNVPDGSGGDDSPEAKAAAIDSSWDESLKAVGA